jgi:gas vesicle protein
MNETKMHQQGITENPLLTFLFGAAVGAAVGASVALLYAPNSGRETRDQIMAKATRIKDSAGEWKDRAVETASDWKERAVTNAHVALDRASDSIKIGHDGAHPDQSMAPAKT